MEGIRGTRKVEKHSLNFNQYVNSDQEIHDQRLFLFYFRLKDPTYVVNAFNVDPLYLKHEQQGAAPDYRVSKKVCVDWIFV
jgi:hypothetical protein